MEEKIVKSGTADIYTNSIGQGFPLIICDGLGCKGFAWKQLRPYLADHHQTIYWNYRGHGQSTLSKIQSDYTMDIVQQDLNAVLAAYNIQDAIFCGYSMGALVSLAFALKNPERVSSLVSICGTYGNPLNHMHDTDMVGKIFPHILSIVNTLPEHMIQRGWQWLASSKLIYYYFTLIEMKNATDVESNLAKYFEHLSDMDLRAFLWTLAAIHNYSLKDELHNITTPTLILAGSRDTLAPVSVSEYMHKELPNNQFSIIDGVTHVAMLEAAEFVQLRIEKFLRDRNIYGY